MSPFGFRANKVYEPNFMHSLPEATNLVNQQNLGSLIAGDNRAWRVIHNALYDPA